MKLHLQRIGMEEAGLHAKNGMNPFVDKQPKDFIKQLQAEN